MAESAQIDKKRPETKGFWTQRVRDPLHVRERRARLFSPPTTAHVIDRVTAALWNWSRREYPGIMRLRAWLLGVASVRTAARYRQIPLPRVRAAFMAGRLRAKIAELELLARELESYAQSRQNLTRVKRKAAVPPPVE